MTAGVSDPKAPVVLGEWTRSVTTEPRPACDGPRLLEQTIRRNRKAAPVADILTRPPDNPEQPRRTLRDKWLAEVWTTTLISDGCRVLLLALGRHMDHKGYVSVPRQQLAAEIGRNERRVGERIEQAVALDFLARVQRGQKGVTSVYRAMLPSPLSRLGDSPLNAQQAANPLAEMGAADQPADGAFSRRPGGPASSKPVGQSAIQSKQEPVGSTSTLPSLPAVDPIEEQEREEAEQVRAAIARACESWGMEVPDELREAGAA